MTKCWDPIFFDALALGPEERHSTAPEQSRMQFKIWKEEEERRGEMGKRGGSGSLASSSTAKGSDMKGFYRQRKSNASASSSSKSKPSRKSPFITTPSLNKPSLSVGVTLGSDLAQPPALLSHSSPDLSGSLVSLPFSLPLYSFLCLVYFYNSGCFYILCTDFASSVSFRFTI